MSNMVVIIFLNIWKFQNSRFPLTSQLSLDIQSLAMIALALLYYLFNCYGDVKWWISNEWILPGVSKGRVCYDKTHNIALVNVFIMRKLELEAKYVCLILRFRLHKISALNITLSPGLKKNFTFGVKFRQLFRNNK